MAYLKFMVYYKLQERRFLGEFELCINLTLWLFLRCKEICYNKRTIPSITRLENTCILSSYLHGLCMLIFFTYTPTSSMLGMHKC